MVWDTTKCETCKNTFDQTAVTIQTDEQSEDFDHHPSLESLQAAVGTGCHLCNMIWDEWRLADDHKKIAAAAPPGFRVVYRLCGDIERGPQNIWFGYKLVDGSGERATTMAVLWTRGQPNNETTPVRGSELLQVKDSTLLHDGIEHHFTNLHVDSSPGNRRMMKLSLPAADLYSQAESTGSEWNLKLARAWLRECVASHPHCEQRTTQELPTRVIDVGSSSDDFVRLYISSESECGSYATLSHCWGKIQPLRLLVSNEAELISRIELSSLLQTFRDAIRVTRALDIRFIWIDSLCIIQDSKDGEDWKRESAKMGTTYKNGLLNIAATASNDGTGGLFRPRNPLTIKPVVLVINTRYNTQMKASESRRTEVWCWPGRLWDRSIESAVLNSRGWVYQERILSPRILHFARSQLFWDCRQSAACETIPTGRPTPMSPEHVSPYRILLDTIHSLLEQPMNLQRTSDTHEPGVQRAYDVWQRIVTAYSNREFSFDGDVPTAILGIAQELQRVLSGYDHYYVGHWLQNLKQELLWSVGPLGDPDARFSTTRLRPLRAPTWSWASIKGPVHFKEYAHFGSMIDITGLEGNKNDAGIVEVESVVLTAPLLEAVVMQDLPFDISAMEARVTRDKEVFSRFAEVGGRFMLWVRLRPDDASYAVSRGFREQDRLIIAILARVVFAQEFEGLWLEATGENENVYERVGRFVAEVLPLQKSRSEDEFEDDDWQRPLMEALCETAVKIKIF